MNKTGEEPILSLPERHNRILALLQQFGSISVAQLAERFKVSEVTIRKDLSYLEQQKKLYRTHGSAILISPYISDRHVNEKEKRNVAEKRAIGPFAEQMLRSFNCSKLFIGVDGIDTEFGLTTTNMLEASLNGAMIDAAQKVIVLADSSKFGRRGFSKICDLESVDRIITDSGVQSVYLDRLRERGIEVTVVDV